MQNPSEASVGGARFFDGSGRDLGWATTVSRRSPLLGSLTILDVTTTDSALTASLVSLDRKRLAVKRGDTSGESYAFTWASGYTNGLAIRIQGVLAHK
jgi:hypothetical protein